MTHCRLIYQSVCARNPIDNADLRDLVQRSAENNRAAGITGLMLLWEAASCRCWRGPRTP